MSPFGVIIIGTGLWFWCRKSPQPGGGGGDDGSVVEDSDVEDDDSGSEKS